VVLPLFKRRSEYALRQAAERGPDLDFIVNNCARSAQRAQPAPKIPWDFWGELTVKRALPERNVADCAIRFTP